MINRADNLLDIAKVGTGLAVVSVLMNCAMGTKSLPEAALYGLIEGVLAESFRKLSRSEERRLSSGTIKQFTLASIIAHRLTRDSAFPSLARALSISPLFMITMLHQIHDHVMPLRESRNFLPARAVSVQ